MSDPWQLMKAGRFHEAADAYSREIALHPTTPWFNNRGMAYLHLGRFDWALSDFEAADADAKRRHHTETEGGMRGVALWLADRHQEAAEVWNIGVGFMSKGKIGYTDAAGGVGIGCLLWFAGVRLQNEGYRRNAERLVKRKAKTRPISSWPGPVALYLLGSVSEAELKDCASDVAILRERELCQAHFYIGVQSLLNGSCDTYTEQMRWAAELGAVAMLEEEYYLARYEQNVRLNV